MFHRISEAVFVEQSLSALGLQKEMKKSPFPFILFYLSNLDTIFSALLK